MPLETVSNGAVDEAAAAQGSALSEQHFAEEFKTGNEAEAVYGDPQGAIDYANNLISAAMYAMTVRASMIAEAASNAEPPVVEPGEAEGRVGPQTTVVTPGDSPVTGTSPESDAATEAMVAASTQGGAAPPAPGEDTEELEENGEKKTAKELRDSMPDMTDEELEDLTTDDRVTVAEAAQAELDKRAEAE